jgi:hypothetical protein
VTAEHDGESLSEYLDRRLAEIVAERLAETPWWCILCGEGGNYEGPRPDVYLPPPADHVCEPAFPPLRGLDDVEFMRVCWIAPGTTDDDLARRNMVRLPLGAHAEASTEGRAVLPDGYVWGGGPLDVGPDPAKVIAIADAFDVPPHALGFGLPRHRWTWRLRRRLRRWTWRLRRCLRRTR